MQRLLQLLGRVVAFVHGLTLDPRLIALGAIGALALTVAFLVIALRTGSDALTVSAGSRLERRHDLAELIAAQVEERGLDLDLVETGGSEEALERVNAGQLDIALVQGGLDVGPNVREVAALVLEPLHVLVKEEHKAQTIDDLEGLRVNVSVPGSGTQVIALRVLAQAGLVVGETVQTTTHDYRTLETLPRDELPDAVFLVSSLPSEVASFLIHERRYAMLEIPFADALRVRHAGVRGGTIPAYTYGGNPPSPPRDVATITTRMLVVAHREVSAKSVRKIVEGVLADDFAREARLPRAEEEELLLRPELALHRGTLEHMRRNEPLLTPEVIDNIESLRSFFVSLAVALFLGWRWWRARQLRGFEGYMAQVTQLEREIEDVEKEAGLDLVQLTRVRGELRAIKRRALEDHAAGELTSTELLNGFLLHVSDVRMHLDGLMLHAREVLEKRARRAGTVHDEEKIMRRLWGRALGEEE